MCLGSDLRLSKQKLEVVGGVSVVGGMPDSSGDGSSVAPDTEYLAGKLVFHRAFAGRGREASCFRDGGSFAGTGLLLLLKLAGGDLLSASGSGSFGGLKTGLKTPDNRGGRCEAWQRYGGISWIPGFCGMCLVQFVFWKYRIFFLSDLYGQSPAETRYFSGLVQAMYFLWKMGSL